MVWPARSVGADELGQSSAMSTDSTVEWTWPSQLVQTPGKKDVTVFTCLPAPQHTLLALGIGHCSSISL